MINWSQMPDMLAIFCLACAFRSLLRHNHSPAHRLWLVGWTLIVMHFVGYMFADEPGIIGMAGNMVGLTTLVAGGICFMWATVPSETHIKSRRMAAAALATTSLYMILASLPNTPGWAFDLSAILIAVGPMSVAITYRKFRQHALRWLTVALQFALGAELLVLRHQSGSAQLGIYAILFVVYMGCCVYFWHSHQTSTTGSFITIGGFLTWASVFVIAPLHDHYFASVHIENEVWNLPKYVVAIGMLLLLLEKQIERSQYLALHDDLTALANRRLFQDRLNGAIERARRTGTTVALLQIDLDGFKGVNDTHGHHIGDLLLQHVSKILEARVRRSDTVARTGGDEFSVILEEHNRRAGAESVAEALRQSLSEPVTLAGERIRIGASIGVAFFPKDAQDFDSLCIEADLRMYREKQDGRDTDPDRRQPASKAVGAVHSVAS
jgi:diguanylate cyclase